MLTDRSGLEMAENLIRRFVSSVFPKRLATTNKKYLEGFDETKARTYAFLVDATNLNGGIMQQIPLPLSEFEIVDVELSTNLKTPNDSGIGFVLEVNLDYPDALHNMHKDFPMAPTKKKTDRNILSEYQMGLLNQAGKRPVTTPKLVQTLLAKKKYTRHYITLKLHVDLALKIIKVLSVQTIKVVGALHQLEHENANSVKEQV